MKTATSQSMIRLQGFINCWSYSWQSLFRNCPDMQNAGDDWLNNLARRVARMEPEDFYTAAVTHYTECLLGGATAVVDCLYLVKDVQAFDKIIKAAKDVGIRLILVRGSMDRNPTGSPILDQFVQEPKDILTHSEDLIKRYHDSSSNSMLQIGLGPCSLSSGSPALYRETALLARRYNVRLFSLLGEDTKDKERCESKAGSMCAYMKELGWSGSDVVFVNCVALEQKDIAEAKTSEVNIVDCPRSNARGTGITKLAEIVETGIPLGIGTAGAAGNDAICMQDELVWARYSQGMRGLKYLDPNLMLKIASEGGARVLGRDDLVWENADKALDRIVYDVSEDLSYAGAVCDPRGSLLGSGKLRVKGVWVNNEVVIKDYQPDFRLYGVAATIRGIFGVQQLASSRIEMG